MAENESGEKTEAPTGKRLEEAREKGQIAKSPDSDAAQAVQDLKVLLEDNAPYQARVTFDSHGGATGWNAPDTAPWFERALNAASQAHFGAPVGYIGGKNRHRPASAGETFIFWSAT
mgnify:CR=1 FL=1